jgi:capsular polysaccharide biosynthesis protein
LLAKKEESKIAADLERRQIGEQFSILDAARLPERPYSPNRQQISLGGVVAGLCVGLALVGALEYRDRSFRTDAEVTTLIELPVLAAVPLMRSAAERRRRLRRIVVVNTLCFSLVAACLAVVAYTLVR